MKKRASYFVDVLLIFLASATLIWPLFRLKYLNSWDLIEGTFISQARFLVEHWPHPGWQPLWYCGTRFDYVYPPALIYGTAFLSKVLGIIPAQAYHLYTAFFYCLGIAGVYLLIRVGSDSRGAAWLGAAGAALVSPAFLFIAHIRYDAQTAYLLPQRLNALVRWAEGPHMTAFALLPIALAAGFAGLRKGRTAALALSAIFSALVVSNNFYGAVALAILFPVLVWSVWLGEQDHLVWLRAALIAALAYALTAPWLSPSYIRVTLRNMRLVSQPGNRWSIWVALAVVALFALGTMKLARGRRERTWSVFVAGTLVFIGLNVLGEYYVHFRVIGEPGRHVPELDLAFILAAVECLRRLWASKIRFRRVYATAIVLVCLYPARHYVRNAWSYFPQDDNYRARVEVRLTEWVAKNIPNSRVLATGTVRFWYSAWHDIAQEGGASEQGTLNEQVIDPYFVATQDQNTEEVALAMQAVGTDALIVPDKTSQEPYHDYKRPEIFAGVFPVLYDDHQGNVIYQIPRRSPGLVHVVEAARVRAIHPVQADTYYDDVRLYTAAMEKGASLQWEGSDRMKIRARLAPGQGVLVQESYDPAWRAYADGEPTRIERDPMGFMLLEPPPGDREIVLAFALPFENLVGYILCGITWAVLIWLLAAAYRSGAGHGDVRTSESMSSTQGTSARGSLR